MNEQLLTRAEAAEYLRASGPRFFMTGDARRIPFAIVSKRALYRRADLDAWLESRLTEVGSAPVAAPAPAQGRRARA